MRADGQRAAGNVGVGNEYIRLRRTGLGSRGELRHRAVRNRPAVYRATEHIVVCRKNDLAIYHTRARRRSESQVAAKQHLDRVRRRLRDSIDHMVVAGTRARRTADITVDIHRVGNAGADRDDNIEQAVVDGEVDLLRSNVGMAAVDLHITEHVDPGCSRDHESVFGRDDDVRARADRDPGRCAGLADQVERPGPDGKVVEAGKVGVQRSQHQPADIEHRGRTDQKAGGGVECHETAGREDPGKRTLEARDHRPVHHNDVAVGGRQNPVQHRESALIGRIEERGNVARRQEIERIAGDVLIGRPVNHRSRSGDFDQVSPGRTAVDVRVALDHVGRRLECLRGRPLRCQRQRHSQRGGTASKQQLRAIFANYGHVRNSREAGGR